MNKPVVMITGALTGIGRATGLAFAEEARIVVSGRHKDAGQKLVAEVRPLDAEAEFIRADVCQEDDVRNLIDQTLARFDRLDMAVNNAGTEGTPGPVIEQSAETYAATFDTNVLYSASKHAVEGMTRCATLEAAEFGVRVNVSSPVAWSSNCRWRWLGMK